MGSSPQINGRTRKGPRPSACTVCMSPQRAQIELRLAGGASIMAVARKFQVPYHAARRHWLNHVSEGTRIMLIAGPTKLGELSSRLADEGVSILDHLRIVRSAIYAMLDAAVVASDRHGTALLASKMHENVSLVAKLTGELSQSPLMQTNVNVTVLPQITALQAHLLRVLADYPDARVAVIRAFHQMEEQETARPLSPPLIEGGRDAVASATPPAAAA